MQDKLSQLVSRSALSDRCPSILSGPFRGIVESPYSFWGIVLLSFAVNLISALGTSIIFQPDSLGYLAAADTLWSQHSLSAIDLNRVPGYSFFLAPFLGLGGYQALFYLKLVQHLMAAATTFFVIKAGDELDPTRKLGLLAGLFSCFLLQYQSYAHLPMSELPSGFLYSIGLWAALRYLRHGHSTAFVLSAFIFSLSCLFRPAAQYLTPILVGLALARSAFPGWGFLSSGRRLILSRKRELIHALLAMLIHAILLGPWMAYNYGRSGEFALTTTLGLNLYSNAVEYAALTSPDSNALRDIRTKWDMAEAIKKKNGEPPETQYSWRNHWPSIHNYMKATGFSLAEADKVYGQAAKDVIRENRSKYFRHCLEGLLYLILRYEPTYLYVPSFEKSENPDFYKWVWDIRISHNSTVETLDWSLKDRFPAFEKKSIFTDPYIRLVNYYHPLVALTRSAETWFSLFVLGYLICLARIGSRNGLLWTFMAGFAFYQLMIPMLVVPWSPRHRLPSDPLIVIFQAAAVLFLLQTAIRLALLTVTRIRTRIQQQGGAS